ncbi:hypothetical protein Tco_0779983 [Tanacetum coccineum]
MSKRKKTEFDLEEEEDLKTFLKIVLDKEGIIEYEVLEKRFPIINWESKFYHYEDMGRGLDLVELYNLVMQRFETITPEGVDLVLWGDLRTMFDANAEDELWQNKERWNIKSWNFYKNCGVHTLTLEDGIVIHMLTERKYPLIKETLKRMMSLKLIAESTSDISLDLSRLTTTLNRLERSIQTGINKLCADLFLHFFMTTSSANNSVFRGFFEKQKLTGPNFNYWYRQLRIVLSIEDKLNYLEQPLPPAPVAPEGQQVALEIITAHNAWIKGSKEIAGLMLMTMEPEIQRNLENLHANDMLKKLKTLFAQQAEREILQTTRDFHSCKQEEG